MLDDEREDKAKPTLTNAENLFPNWEAGCVPAARQIPSPKAPPWAYNKTGAPLDELSEAASAIHKQKAVKANDAVVPVHLWEQNLFDSTPKWEKQKIDPEQHVGSYGLACWHTGKFSFHDLSPIGSLQDTPK